MSIFRCKMCGGSLEIEEGNSYGTCEFCGTQQTVPTVKDENVKNLFNRANVLRMKSEFDKAADLYEKIIQKNETEAEAYWGLILCKYGIEYVEDPVTYERIPTCHRASYDAVVSDDDYKNAIAHADMMQRGIYEKQAKAIDEIQKGILALAQKEKPYDVFICYKETDENGNRTVDSVIANDIYHHLTQEGYKVFYAAITLEDKLGQEYEPYIFAALNSAKVMLALGTDPDYFNAVWVKNEWSRFMKIMKKDRNKLLIPCYRDMDPYELPEEFAHLQAQDMNKIGFINDVVRGIKKVITKESDPVKAQQTVTNTQPVVSGTTTNVQVMRGNMALEDKEWDKADGFFEEALNIDPQCAEAYLGKLLASNKKASWESLVDTFKNKYIKAGTERLQAGRADEKHIDQMTESNAVFGYLKESEIREKYKFDFGYDSCLYMRRNQKKMQEEELDADRLLSRVKQYAKGDTKKMVEDGLAEISSVLQQRIDTAENDDDRKIKGILEAYKSFLSETDKTVEKMNSDAKANRESDYQTAVGVMKTADGAYVFQTAKDAFEALSGYKDSDELAMQCQNEIDRINEEQRKEEERQAEARRLEEERQAAIRKKEAEEKAKKTKKIISIIAIVAIASVIAYFLVTKVIIPNSKYKSALKHIDAQEYIEAYKLLDLLDDYKDSKDIKESIYADYEMEVIKEELKTNNKVGNCISFGFYEQDNNSGNGKEPIEWIVLDDNDGKVLLISKFALDCKRYNEERKGVTWETCSIRTWLNEDFVYEAFSSEEQAFLVNTTVPSGKNPKYSTNPGNDTTDQVFLLSLEEVEQYCNSNNDRMCAPTKYAISQGAYTLNWYSVDGHDTCWWWLRSPGNYAYDAAFVYNDGSVDYDGDYVYYDPYCVRPALWINLKP